MNLPRIIVVSGPTATLLNTPTLPRILDDGRPGSEDRAPVPRLQRIAANATLRVEAMSAHPLQPEYPDEFGVPDGYLDESGALSEERRSDATLPVWEVELNRDQPWYWLPYTPRGSIDARHEGTLAEPVMQTFFPDASDLFEVLDHYGLDDSGRNKLFSRIASYEFHRILPSGGYPSRGESAGRDFFPYSPETLRAEPTVHDILGAVNSLHRLTHAEESASCGVIWLEGSPTIEDSLYLFELLIDIEVPIVGVSAQRRFGMLGYDGGGNLYDGVRYITSRQWEGVDGKNALGCVLVVDGQVYPARHVSKNAGHVGGYGVSGPGGILGEVGRDGRTHISYVPRWRCNWNSPLRLGSLPAKVQGVLQQPGGLQDCLVPILDAEGYLLPGAAPLIITVGGQAYGASGEVDGKIVAQQIQSAREINPLVGVILIGKTPTGAVHSEIKALLIASVREGVPVVACSRGAPNGWTWGVDEFFIEGGNLTADKARILLLCAMLKFGALPRSESDDINGHLTLVNAIRAYQEVFDTC